MSVGTLSSQSAQAPAPTLLRSGEAVSSSPAGIKAGKTFYHTIPGARFVMPDGLELQFLGGQFATVDEAQIAELSKIADKPSSMIFTKREEVAQAKAVQGKAADDAAKTDGPADKASA